MDDVAISKYTIDQHPNGFLITAPDRKPTEVFVKEGGFAIKQPYYSSIVCGFIEGHSLIRSVASSLMENWKPKGKTKGKRIKEWAVNKTRKALAKRISAERIRLIEKVDPIIIAVQKSVFRTCGKLAPEVTYEDFYKKDKYYIKDVINFRAAACTAFGQLTLDDGEDWKMAYTTPHIGVYSSLNKTLTNLPGCIPIHLLSNMKWAYLPRPVYSRRELTFILGCASHPEWRRGVEPIQHIIYHASAEEITRAAKLLGAHLRNPINLRKTEGVLNLSTYIMDAAPYLTHNGNIVGLTEKSIDWHRQAQWSSVGIPPDVLTAVPPIPLPANKGIIFLKNVREVVEEGQNQHHCIGSYAKASVKGDYYLFHINYKNQTASAQVDARTRQVVQSYGVYNSTNEASKWAKIVLGKWAEKLPDKKRENVHNYMREMEEDFNMMPF